MPASRSRPRPGPRADQAGEATRGSGLTVDSSKRIAADDWTDQDLLTRGEARERLVAEIETESAELARLRESGDPGPRVRAEIETRTRRLAALKAARADM